MDDDTRLSGRVRTVAMLGNHLPRHCGIATFTTDLTQAIVSEVPDVDCFVLAMNDPGMHHAYPPRVRFEIAEADVAGYRRAADFLNVNGVDVLSVQHEYGIFGPKAGVNVLELLRELRMPVVTTLHTIVGTPSAVQRAVMDSLVAMSERVIVMSSDGGALLHQVHGVDVAKIDVIPHGIPMVPERAKKDRLGVEGRSVILTFGLLSPDKGIEHVIDAMPRILERHPKTVYVVLGATHPHVKQRTGESYRHMLETRAERLGVAENVIFHNRFVSHEELVEFLGAADIYITPYLNEAQSTSGTLAYAVGSGKAVISTPYRYARELLSDGRGILVGWRDSAAIASEIVGLLDHPEKRLELQKRAAAFGRGMSWPIVARRYVDSFERARASFDGRRRSVRPLTLARRPPDPPEIDLSHVHTLTDDTGILQHARFTVPHYADGYCVDDNARALLLMTLVGEEGTESPRVVSRLANRYLAFLNHAFDEGRGRFRNFLTYARDWVAAEGSEDSHGRAVWALGAVIGRGAETGSLGLSSNLFHAALPATLELTSPRAWSYVLLGIDEYLRAYQGDSRVEAIALTLSQRLLERYHHSTTPDWLWFEDRLTYCNPRLPQALMLSAARTGHDEMRAVAERTLNWLVAQYRSPNGTFAPVGSNGFHVRGQARADFDQQPVEACAMVSACLAAHRVTGDAHWANDARRAFDWFLGQNALQSPVFDVTTGGCRDGIHVDRLNENQGAESTLSFLLALAELRAADRLASKLISATGSRPRAEGTALHLVTATTTSESASETNL
jgi:glycosyltransferase involved in cell wall biosynthesis